jgi:hypothetical protein
MEELLEKYGGSYVLWEISLWHTDINSPWDNKGFGDWE